MFNRLRSPMCILLFLMLIANCPQVLAQQVPKEIRADCEKLWGSNYEMQVFCIKKQLKALSELNQIDTNNRVAEISDVEPIGIWGPSDHQTSIVTSSIRVSDNQIEFANGEALKVSRLSGTTADIETTFKVLDTKGPKLLYGNTLCDGTKAPNYLVFRKESPKIAEIIMYVFCGQMPSVAEFKDDDPSISGGYWYTRSNDQKSWKIETNLEQKWLLADVKNYCEEKFSAKNTSKRARKCISVELAAQKKLDEKYHLRNNQTAIDKLNEYKFYTRGNDTYGTMEYQPVADAVACMESRNAQKAFADCYNKFDLNGFVWLKNSYPKASDSTESAARCFSKKIRAS
jgi:hypothetical protein